MINSRSIILITDLADGDGRDYENLLQQDTKVQYQFFITSSKTQILALSQSHQFDVIILDSHQSGLRSRSLRDRSKVSPTYAFLSGAKGSGSWF